MGGAINGVRGRAGSHDLAVVTVFDFGGRISEISQF